jgi:hypothetical protein
MSLATTYTNGKSRATVPHRLPGVKHKGPHWVASVQVLRSAIHNAREHAGWRSSATPDTVGTVIIDTIGELDSRALHVLAVTHGILVRASKRDQ